MAMVLFIPATHIFARRDAFQTTIQPWKWHSHPPLRWRVRIGLMQIDLFKTLGPESVSIAVRWRKHDSGSPLRLANPFIDPRALPGRFSVQVLARVIESFVNHVLTNFQAATKDEPLIPMPPRRQSEALSPRGRGGVKRLPRAADPPVLELPFRHRCRLPSGGPEQQKSPHHQARDTLQGDESA
jgi:hypothetical protein